MQPNFIGELVYVALAYHLPIQISSTVLCYEFSLSVSLRPTIGQNRCLEAVLFVKYSLTKEIFTI